MKEINTTRRSFLKLAGTGLAGAALMAAPAMAESTSEAPAYPWTWQQLDKDEVRAKGYDGYFNKGGCCAGVVNGVVALLAEKYGYPYNQIEPTMFANGGGGYGVGTLCGALGGGCAVLGLFCQPADSRALRDKLFAWYSSTALPIYQPEKESITTVANSITCADSLGTYLKESGYEKGSEGHFCRCGGVTADVAAKVVEMLNVFYGFEAEAVAEEAPAETALADNEYIGEAQSTIGGTVKVKVTMDGDKIAKIDVLEQNETVGIGTAALEQIPQAIIDAQSADVQAVSGATCTSDALIAAVKDALSKVK